MIKSITREIYHHLDPDKPMTAAGACRLVDNVLYNEAMDSLEWLASKGFAIMVGTGPFGREYVRAMRG